MSKKRTKSPANNAANNNKWESNIVSSELNEEHWNYSLSLLVENIIDDKITIEYIRKGMQTGLRKKFSLLSTERITELITEYGGTKTKKGKDAPQNYEVCECAKAYLDRGEKIPVTVIARLIKWLMLTAKAEDIKTKLDLGKKSDDKGSKSKKPAEKVDRSKSSAGKKGAQAGGKRSPEPASVKGETKLRKRGDPDPDKQFIDDEPDDGSSRYFVITGITDTGVIEALAEIGCIVTSVIKVTRDIHIPCQGNEKNEEEDNESSDSKNNKEIEGENERVSEILTMFWTNLTGILNSNKQLFNTPVVTLVAKHLMFPIDQEDTAQQDRCAMELFESVAVSMYDLLDLRRQWKNYLDKSKIIELPMKYSEEKKLEPAVVEPAKEDKMIAEDVTVKIEESVGVTFEKVDMDYYHFLMHDVPVESSSNYLLMSAMLDQVDVTSGEKAADLNRPKFSQQNDLSEDAAEMLSGMVDKLCLSKQELQDLREKLQLNSAAKEGNIKREKEAPIHALDGISLRDVGINSENLGKEGSMIRELRMLIASFRQMDILHTIPVEDTVARRRAARLQEFLKYIDNAGLSKIEMNYATKLFILESLVLSGTDENGILRVNDEDGVFPKNINQTWDDPFIVLDDVAQSIISEEHVAREAKVEMVQDSSDSARPGSAMSDKISFRSTDGILITNRSSSHSSEEQRSGRRRSSVHFREVEKNELSAGITEGELDVTGMLIDEHDEILQTILLEYLYNVRKRSFTEWCFEEFYEPHVLLQIIQEAFYKLPFVDIYSERKSDGKILVLHNPFQEKLRYNHQSWNQWLHANVGFRNYLDFINDKITDWTRDEEAIYQAQLLSKELEKTEIKATEEEIPKVIPKKGAEKGKTNKSRSRSVSRSSSADESDNKELQFVLPGSLKAQKMEHEKVAKQKEEEERKKEEKRSLSAQKKAEKDANKDKVKRPSSKASNKSKSKRSVIEDATDQTQLLSSEPLKTDADEYWPFVGYDIGDNLAHFAGEVAHLFPSDGCTIRVQKTEKLLDTTSVRVSIVTPQSHVFSLHIIDPTVNDDEQIDNIDKVLDQFNSQRLISRYGAATCVFNDGVCIAASNYGYSANATNPDKVGVGKDQAVEAVESHRSDDNVNMNVNSLPGTTIIETISGSVSFKNLNRDNVDLRDVQNVIFTSPNGVQVRVGYDLDGNDQQRSLLLYMTKNDPHSFRDQNKDQLKIVKELGRYVMSDGRVISVLSNDLIKVMFPDGTVAATSLHMETTVTREEDTEEMKIEKANPRETPSQKKKKTGKMQSIDQAAVTDANVLEEHKEIIKKTRLWTITRPDGEIYETKADLNVLDVTETLPKIQKNLVPEDGINTMEEEIPTPEVPQWKKYLSNSCQKESLLISFATDPATGETIVTRSDGTLLLTTQEAGIFLSEHVDRTRFTKYFLLEKTPQAKDSSTEMGEPKITEIIQIESENYPMITIDRATGKMETRCGSLGSLVSVPDGSHFYKHSDGTEIEYRPDGEMIFTAAGNSQMSYLQPYGSSSYVLNTMNNIICEMLDTDGSEFVVDSCGNYEVKRVDKESSKSDPIAENEEQGPPKPTSAISGASLSNINSSEPEIRKFDQHAPRIFFLNADGSGSELLRYRDIVDTIVNAEIDNKYFQYKESIQDHPQIIGHTIVDPITKNKPWTYEYSRKTVIPKGLTCRDLKTFPSKETITEGPPFAMTIGKGLSIGTNPFDVAVFTKESSITKPRKSIDSLEFRQFYHYPLITDEIRNNFATGLVEYNKSILRQRQKYKDLEPVDDRSCEEQTLVEEMKSKFDDMKEIGLQILDNAIHALDDAVQSPTSTNQNKISIRDTKQPLKPNRKRLEILLEKERIEKEKEIENKNALRNKTVPSYFTSIYGKEFLMNQAVDLKTLNRSMKLFPVSREATARNEDNTNTMEAEPLTDSSLYTIEVELENRLAVTGDSKQTTKLNQSSTKGSENPAVLFKKKERKYVYYDSNLILPTLPKRMPVSYDLPLPRYLYSERPSVEQNVKQATIEDPVRRKQLMTSLIGGPAIGQIFQRQCRGINVLPARIDTGLLREGGRYSFKIKLINTGPETSFFKIKQPPASSCIWVDFIPGPIAAGLSRQIIVRVYAIAKSIDSNASHVYVIDQPLKIITNTDILEIPITGRVMTADKYDIINPSRKIVDAEVTSISEPLPVIKDDNKSRR